MRLAVCKRSASTIWRSRAPSTGSVRLYNFGEEARLCWGTRRFVSVPAEDLDEDRGFVMVPKARFDELIESEVAYLGSIPVRAVSMQEVLDFTDPHKAAKFIQTDVPKRFALRIRLIDSLEEWRDIPELVDHRERLAQWYSKLRLVRRGPDLDLKEFTRTVRNIRTTGKNAVALTSAGMQKLQARTGSKYSDEFIDRWLDGFFVSRIGSNMLIDQYLACASQSDGGEGKATGIVDPACDAYKLCRQAVAVAGNICSCITGQMPVCTVENYTAGMRGPQPEMACKISYVPGFLRYIVVELLKNSFHATVKYCGESGDISQFPIKVIVTCDSMHVVLRISDLAGGIPMDKLPRIWSYLDGAAAQGKGNPNALAGYGVGLPLSRLHATYLGGSLNISTYPGFGTDACVMLPRLEVEPKNASF